MNDICHIALIVLASTMLHVKAMTPFSPVEGFAVLEILETTPDLVVCALRVSGGNTSKLLAIQPGKYPHILWRVPSRQKTWHTRSFGTNDLYTIEGNILQRRRKKDGVILGQRDLRAIQTATSKRRPWTDLEEQIAEKTLLADTAKGNRKKELLDSIADLQVNIEAKKAQWAYHEKIASTIGGEKGSGGFTFSFLNKTNQTLRVMRAKWRFTSYGFSYLYGECLEFEPKSGKLINSSEIPVSEIAEHPEGSNHNTSSFDLRVVGNTRIPKMDSKSKPHKITLVATDPEDNKEKWHLTIPVVIKCKPDPLHEKRQN